MRTLLQHEQADENYAVIRWHESEAQDMIEELSYLDTTDDFNRSPIVRDGEDYIIIVELPINGGLI